MEQFDRLAKENLIYPKAHYRGDFTPERLIFNANLQEFALKVSLITGLHTGGKLSTTQAYEKIHDLWCELKHSKKSLLAKTNGDSGENA
jgi:hypothetical protein